MEKSAALQTQKPQRILAYDALRILAMLAVIGIHAGMTSRGLGADRSQLIISIENVIRFAVPLLVFISGALVWGRPFKSGKGKYLTFMKRRLSRIGLPYVAWFVVYALIAWALPGQSFGWLTGVRAAPEGVADFFLRLLSGHIWYHLYFIPMILSFAALTPLVSRIIHFRPSWSAPAFFLATLVFKALVYPAISSGLQTILAWDVWICLTHIVQHLPHMAMGAWFALCLAAWQQSRGKAVVGGRAGAVDSVAAGTTKSVPAGFMTVVSRRAGTMSVWLNVLKWPLYVLVLAVSAVALEPLWQKIKKPLIKISGLTFGAYFTHPILLAIIQAAIPDLGPRVIAGQTTYLFNELWFVVLLFVVLTVVSFAAAYLLSRFRITVWLIGE